MLLKELNLDNCPSLASADQNLGFFYIPALLSFVAL